MTAGRAEPSGPGIDSLGYLLGRAALVEQRVRELVAERRADDPAPDDPFRGLYLTDDAVDRLLQDAPAEAVTVQTTQLAILDAEADRTERSGVDVRLRRLARQADLTSLDVELLMIALLPDLDSRFERLYGYLNDDVTRRRASVGLALQLAGVSGLSADGPRPAGAEPATAAARARAGRGHRAAVADPRPPGPRPGRRPPAR